MAYNTITVRCHTVVREEAIAAGTITPGMLCERDSNDKFVVHNSAGARAQRLFAVEDDLQGDDIDTNYATTGDNTRVQANIFRAGDLVWALLANGENAAIGDLLVSNGDGYLKEATAPTSADPDEIDQDVVAIAREALDMSGSSAVDPASQRILVEIV